MSAEVGPTHDLSEAQSISPFDRALSFVATTPRLLVCCDFDGTIASLAAEPAAARPVDGAMAALNALGNMPHTWSAVISGRALIDLSRLAGVPGRVHLVGSHGTEFEVGSIVALNPGESDLLEAIVEQCDRIVAGVAGALVEVKPASVAVHVRQARRPDAEEVLAAVRAGPGSLSGVHVIPGKEVLELAVFSGTKADGLNALRQRWDVSGCVFAGDDVTDESAFAVLSVNDVGIKVGEGSTLAPWRVADPVEVVEVLHRLASLRSQA